MPADRSRGPEDQQRCKAVVMQQGRVILDRDFNALQEFFDREISADALDAVGACGTPDNGFAISFPACAVPVPVAQSFSGPNPLDFLIAPGTMYVGGQRICLPPPASGQQPWSYFNQPDWLSPSEPAKVGALPPPLEYVYLHVFEQEVSAVEDPDLLDVALGGPDTTQRVRLMWRVVRKPTTATDCPSALAQFSGTSPDASVPSWLDKGYDLRAADMRLLPLALLEVGFTSTAATNNPCDPVAQGGYLGAENQLIRLQIAPAVNGQPQLLWGYDNASFIYRISSISADGQTLTLAQAPVDAFHCPRANQYVEVLRSTAALGGPGSTSSRYVAESVGFIVQLQSSYNSNANSVVLNAAVPTQIANDPNPLFLRVWQGQQPITAGLAMALTDPTQQTAPGITVTITTPPPPSLQGKTLPVGASWLIAVRPSTPQLVYPERYLNGRQPPDEPRQWVCPLGIVEWPGNQGNFSGPASPPSLLCDCRQSFVNLVTLSARKLSGCCMINFVPDDSPTIQQQLDAVVGKGQPVQACFAPGTYALPAPLWLTALHSNLTLEGCGGSATIQAAADADPLQFLNGLIVMVGANNVTLCELTLVPPPVPYPYPVFAFNYPPMISSGSAMVLIAVRPANCQGLTLDNCRVEFSAPTAANQFVFAVGLFLAGDCTGLTVRNCHFGSQINMTSNYTQWGAPFPAGIAAGPDGKLWFTVYTPPGYVGSYDPVSKQMSLYTPPSPSSDPWTMVAGPDGNMWFWEALTGSIASINPTTHQITEYSSLGLKGASLSFAIGPDKNLWFVQAGQIVKVALNTPTPTFTPFPAKTAGNSILNIAFSPDGNLWFTETGGTNSIVGMLNLTTSVMTEYPFLATNSTPTGIVAGPDGNMWVIENGTATVPFKIAVINPKTSALASEITIAATGLTGINIQLVPTPSITAVPKNATFTQGSIWFIGPSSLGVIDIAKQNQYTPIPLTTGYSNPYGMVTGPDGNVWFLEVGPNSSSVIGMVNATTKALSNFTIESTGVALEGLTRGPDGNLWFAEFLSQRIGMINVTTPQVVTTIPIGNTAPTIVASIGILDLLQETAGASDERFRNDLPYLTDASFQNNHFDNLTMPVFLEGAAGSMLFEDNRVTQCLSGLALWVSGAPLGASMATAFQFKEIQLASSLATSFPLPPGFVEASRAAQPALSLTIANNCISAQPRSLSTYSTSALMICANGPGSILVTSNDISCRAPTTSLTPIPTMSVTTNAATTITGNVINNVTAGFSTAQEPLCLLITPADGTTNTSYLAVTGNTLKGQHNLASLHRADCTTAPFNTWVLFNSCDPLPVTPTVTPSAGS